MKKYTYNELSDNAKKVALENHRYDNVTDSEWNSEILSDWKEKLEKLGFVNPELNYTGFYSQGDGASFTYDKIDFKAENAINWIFNHCPKDKIEKFIKDYDLGLVNFSIKGIRNSHQHYHENTVTHNVDIDGPLEEYENQIEKNIKYFFDELCEKIYSDLEEEYSNETDEDTIISLFGIEESDFYFNEDGTDFDESKPWFNSNTKNYHFIGSRDEWNLLTEELNSNIDKNSIDISYSEMTFNTNESLDFISSDLLVKLMEMTEDDEKSLINFIDYIQENRSKIITKISEGIGTNTYSDNANWGGANVWHLNGADYVTGTFLVFNDDSIVILKRKLKTVDSYGDEILFTFDNILSLEKFIENPERFLNALNIVNRVKEYGATYSNDENFIEGPQPGDEIEYHGRTGKIITFINNNSVSVYFSDINETVSISIDEIIEQNDYSNDENFIEGPQPGDVDYHYDEPKTVKGIGKFENIDWDTFWNDFQNGNIDLSNVYEFLTKEELSFLEDKGFIEKSRFEIGLGESYLNSTFKEWYSDIKSEWDLLTNGTPEDNENISTKTYIDAHLLFETELVNEDWIIDNFLSPEEYNLDFDRTSAWIEIFNPDEDFLKLIDTNYESVEVLFETWCSEFDLNYQEITTTDNSVIFRVLLD